MLKTTIPTLEIKSSGVDLTSIQTIFISIKQREFETTKSNDEIEVDNNVISVSLKKTEYEKFKNGDISISINAYGYDGNSYKIKTEWAKFGSRTSYEEGSGGGGVEYDILPTVDSVKNNTESGKLVDALAIKEVFISVSDGKELIASAITDKGVQTGATATFAEMADNIGNIQGGGSGEDCPIASPYLFELNSKIPFSTSGGYVRFPFPIAKLKRIVIKKLYVYGRKTSTSNSSGSIYFYIKGKKTGSASESNVQGWGGALYSSNASKKLVDITVDTELDLSGFEEITCAYLQKGSAGGTVVNTDVTLQFQAELYF